MRNKGFSLIELMIVVAIIAIISSVALPSYTSYIARSKRTECRAAVMQVMQQQERYFTQQNAYLAFAAGDANVPMKQFSGDTLATSACTISSNVCTGSSVSPTPAANASGCAMVKASPYNRTDPVVGDITYQSDGTKSCTGVVLATEPAKCWTN